MKEYTWTATAVCLFGGKYAEWTDMLADAIARGEPISASFVEVCTAHWLTPRARGAS